MNNLISPTNSMAGPSIASRSRSSYHADPIIYITTYWDINTSREWCRHTTGKTQVNSIYSAFLELFGKMGMRMFVLHKDYRISTAYYLNNPQKDKDQSKIHQYFLESGEEVTFATTSNPLVPLSNLCTIPGRTEASLRPKPTPPP